MPTRLSQPMTAALLGLVLSITTAFTPDLAIPEDVTHSPVVDPSRRSPRRSSPNGTSLVVTEWEDELPGGGRGQLHRLWETRSGAKHQGTIWPTGTPVVAVTNGTITRVDRTTAKASSVGGRSGSRPMGSALTTPIPGHRRRSETGRPRGGRRPHCHGRQLRQRPQDRPTPAFRDPSRKEAGQPYPTLALVCAGAR